MLFLKLCPQFWCCHYGRVLIKHVKGWMFCEGVTIVYTKPSMVCLVWIFVHYRCPGRQSKGLVIRVAMSVLSQAIWSPHCHWFETTWLPQGNISHSFVLSLPSKLDLHTGGHLWSFSSFFGTLCVNSLVCLSVCLSVHRHIFCLGFICVSFQQIFFMPPMISDLGGILVFYACLSVCLSRKT